MADQFCNDLGIGVGGLFGSAIPGDVWLDDDDVGARNEALDAAHFLKRTANELLRLAAGNHGKLREILRCRYGVTALGVDDKFIRAMFATMAAPIRQLQQAAGAAVDGGLVR